jgi:hypothetical protein
MKFFNEWNVMDDMVWYGMVWYGMVWYRVWYGVWYSMIWYLLSNTSIKSRSALFVCCLFCVSLSISFVYTCCTEAAAAALLVEFLILFGARSGPCWFMLDRTSLLLSFAIFLCAFSHFPTPPIGCILTFQ